MAVQKTSWYAILDRETREVIYEGAGVDCASFLGCDASYLRQRALHGKGWSEKCQKFPDLEFVRLQKGDSRHEEWTRSMTLCWRCANTNGNRCPWFAKDAKPVEGWKALRRDLYMSPRKVESYIVIDCPLFEEEGKYNGR